MSHSKANVVTAAGVAATQQRIVMPRDASGSEEPRRWDALREFLRAERAGGVVLIAAGIVAVIWANSAASPSYFELQEMQIGARELPFWINDGLMAIFFLLVGLELRREMTQGELAEPGQLAAPAIAALGGMIVPAAIFSLCNYQDHFAMRGWAVSVATDIAFALAVLRVLGRRVPLALTVFLTALAIIDDLGAIIVIALFYSYHLHLEALAAAAALLAGLWALNRAKIRMLPLYLLGGVALWLLVLRSGVHATLSGVALAFVIPARPDRADGSGPALRLQRWLEPLVAFVILPLFGLMNAGLQFSSLPHLAWAEALAFGTTLALVVGKPVGVFGTLMLARRFKLATLPAGVTTLQLGGASLLCGIGFTMSLFIADLAFGDSPREDEVKLAVFVASIAAAVLGLATLAVASRTRRSS